jgi:ATP-dependent protease ClpP protease subunit
VSVQRIASQPQQPVAPPPELQRPQIRLHGSIGQDTLAVVIDGIAGHQDRGEALVFELTTLGGDADVAIRIAEDIRLFREQSQGRALFLGKGTVYSSGMTIMSAFRPEDRWLTRGTRLLIHERSIETTVTLAGPLALERIRLQMLLADMDAGLEVQEEGFRALVEGAQMELAELRERARTNWYLSAEEAVERGLAAGLV